MSADERARFVRAIRERPEEDSLRLVFADWLQDHGDAHGELIVLQCAIASLPELSPKRLDLEARAAVLWPERHAWRTRLESMGADFFVFDQVRGFFPMVRATPALILDGRLDAILDLEPITGLLIEQELDGAALQRLARWPGLASIRELHLGDAQTPAAELAAFLGSPNLRALRRLSLERLAPTLEIMNALSDSPALSELRQLYLANVDETGLMALMRSRTLAQLRALRMVSCAVTDPIVELLGQARFALEELVIWGGQAFDADPMQRFAQLPGTARLVRLTIGGCPTGDAGLAALASARLPALRELVLLACGGERTWAESVAASPWLGQLARLNLGHNRLTVAGLQAILDRVSPELRELELPAVHLGLAGVEIVARAPRLAGLVRLDLTGWELGEAGALLLAQSPTLASLRALHLYPRSAKVPWRSAGQKALTARFGMAETAFEGR